LLNVGWGLKESSGKACSGNLVSNRGTQRRFEGSFQRAALQASERGVTKAHCEGNHAPSCGKPDSKVSHCIRSAWRPARSVRHATGIGGTPLRGVSTHRMDGRLV
jgi:hypothetical protein